MRKINGEIGAWLTEYDNPAVLKHENPKVALNTLVFSAHDMKSSGWTRVGMATITVEIVDDDQIIAGKVESLRAEITKTRADAEEKCMGLERKVQQLLAIEFSPAEPVTVEDDGLPF